MTLPVQKPSYKTSYIHLCNINQLSSIMKWMRGLSRAIRFQQYLYRLCIIMITLTRSYLTSLKVFSWEVILNQ